MVEISDPQWEPNGAGQVEHRRGSQPLLFAVLAGLAWLLHKDRDAQILRAADYNLLWWTLTLSVCMHSI